MHRRNHRWPARRAYPRAHGRRRPRDAARAGRRLEVRRLGCAAARLDRYGYKVAGCETGALPTTDAARRLREWERKGKNASSLNQWLIFNLNATAWTETAFPQLAQRGTSSRHLAVASFPQVERLWRPASPPCRDMLRQPVAQPLRTQRNGPSGPCPGAPAIPPAAPRPSRPWPCRCSRA